MIFLYLMIQNSIPTPVSSNMMVMKKDVMNGTACNSHYCSVNDSINPQGVGEEYNKKVKQSHNHHDESSNLFCTPSSASASSASVEQHNKNNSTTSNTITSCHHQHPSSSTSSAVAAAASSSSSLSKNESNYSNYSSTAETRLKSSNQQPQTNDNVIETDDDGQQHPHQHHPNCCLNLRESCVDSPCVSIQQPLLSNNPSDATSTSTSNQNEKIEANNISGATASTNPSATVVTIGLDGNTGFNVYSKKILDERDQCFATSELRTFKSTKKESSNNVNTTTSIQNDTTVIEGNIDA